MFKRNRANDILHGNEDLLELPGPVPFPPRALEDPESNDRFHSSLHQEDRPAPSAPRQVYHSELTPQPDVCDRLDTVITDMFETDAPHPFDHISETEEVASRPFDEFTVPDESVLGSATSKPAALAAPKASLLGPLSPEDGEAAKDPLIDALAPGLFVSSSSEALRNTSPLTVPMSESMVMETLEDIAGESDSYETPQEIEIPIDTHREYLASVGQGRRLPELKYKQILASLMMSNPSRSSTLPEEASFNDERLLGVDINNRSAPIASRGAPKDMGNRGSRRRTICIATALFVCGIGVGLLCIWKWGASNPFKKQETSATGAGDSFLLQWPSAAPSEAPTARPTTSKPPTGVPTVTGSEFPSLRPSLSFQPSKSPAPTSSQIPSAVPSITPGPTITYSPSNLPTVITEFPSVAPSSKVTLLPELPTDAPSAGNGRICNGLASNCNKHVNEIMYATVHNAMSSQADGFAGPNNLKPLEDALTAGFRGFLIDSCNCGDEGVQLCHSVCWAGSRDPKTVFDAIERFLRSYPNDIIIIEIQVEDDSLWDLFETVSPDFMDLMYSHPGNFIPWPTLNRLIDLGQRIIVFQHNGGDCDVIGNCPDGVHDMWTYAFETTWELDGKSEFDDYDVSCQLITGAAWTPNSFMLNNHFVGNLFGLPSDDIAKEINTAEALQDRMDACYARIGRRTNFLAVDFWSIGDTVGVVDFNNAQLVDDSRNIFD